jgi:hypothetical protein
VEKGVQGMNQMANLKPHLITSPISLIALGIVAVIIFVLFGAPWYAYVLVIAMVAVSIFILIKYPQLRLQDKELLDYLIRAFRGFRTDASERRQETEETAEGPLAEERDAQYQENRGLFLVHTWKFSEKRGQVADIIIQPHQHLDTSTRLDLLKAGKVESVRYELGRRFFDAPVTKTNKEGNFALEVSAYRPMLCLAEVTFNDDHPPIHLSRYVDFPTDS